MADVEEIRVYLDAHPDDHKQRFRLAKKLYEAWDYRSALEQLLLLREAWPDQLPVSRYLAATYYRLGKYDDATDALAGAVAAHPDDASLLEQLAKIQEGSGQLEKAVDSWERVQAIRPGPAAEEALERLAMALGGTISSSSGFTVQGVATQGGDTLRTCPHCGEGNDLFSVRCTRCHGEMGSPSPAVPPQEEPAPFVRASGVVIALSFLAVAGVAVALFFWLT